MYDATVPSPLEIARGRALRRDAAPADGLRRQLECLACARMTEHVKGPATYREDGSVLVQWWQCVECPDGHTVG